MGDIKAEIESIAARIEELNFQKSNIGKDHESNSNNVVVAPKKDYDVTPPSKDDNIHAIIKEMYANSRQWHESNDAKKQQLNKRNLALGAMLSNYGIYATRNEPTGTWYVGNELLFDKYRQYCYHQGGVAGNDPTLRQNEIMAVLEKGEIVLDAKKERGLSRLIDFATVLSEKFGALVDSTDFGRMFNSMRGDLLESQSDALKSVEGNGINIQFGDTIIYGANDETVAKHQEVTRRFANDIFEQLRVKR